MAGPHASRLDQYPSSGVRLAYLGGLAPFFVRKTVPDPIPAL